MVSSCSVAEANTERNSQCDSILGGKASATDFNAFANTNLGQSDLDVILHGPNCSDGNADTFVADDDTRFVPAQKSVNWPYVKPTSKSCMPFPVKLCSSQYGYVRRWVSRAERLTRYSAENVGSRCTLCNEGGGVPMLDSSSPR